MKKLIAAGSLCLSLVFALALANADDSPPTGNPGSNTSAAAGSQQPGTSTPTDMTSGDAAGPDTGTITSQTTRETEVKTSKSCTDQNGLTYRKGESGYGKCMRMLKRHRDQMGGASDASSDAGAMGGGSESSPDTSNPGG